MALRSVLAGAGFLALAGLMPASAVLAQSGGAPAVSTAASKPTDVTAQRRIRRQPTRLRVYRSFPGPNSQRVCNARYVQEYRPSGTVIVPVVNCYWSG